MIRYSTTIKSGTRRNQENKKSSKLRSNKSKLISALIVMVVLVSSFLYLFEINNMAVKGYQIRDLEKKIAELKVDNESLGLEVVELQSMRNLRAKVAKYNFVEADRIDYVSWHDTSFAQR